MELEGDVAHQRGAEDEHFKRLRGRQVAGGGLAEVGFGGAAGARLGAGWRASAAQLYASWLGQALPRRGQACPARSRTEAFVEMTPNLISP